MTVRLDDATADRLTKILGMLGSAHPGERAAAALKADTSRRRDASTSTSTTILSPRPSAIWDTEISAVWRLYELGAIDWDAAGRRHHELIRQRDGREVVT
jgi:hypothetical protein